MASEQQACPDEGNSGVLMSPPWVQFTPPGSALAWQRPWPGKAQASKERLLKGFAEAPGA